MSPKTALVIGSRGQDGALISKALLSKNYQVIGLAKERKGPSETQIQLGIEKDIIEIQADITDFENINYLISKYLPDEIYNLAAQSSVGKSFFSPKETIESIVNGTTNILEVTKQLDYKGRIFFAGSSEVFGETLKPATINHSQCPKSPYAIAKQTSFNLVKFYREVYGLQCVTGVLFNHESPYRSNEFVTQKIILGAIKCSNNKSHKINLGNIDIARDWGWAEEYMEAIQLINNSKIIKDQIICTGKLTSLKKFIEITFNKLDLNWQDHIKSNKKLFRDTDILISYGNPKQLKMDLKWEAKIKIEEMIEKLIQSKV